MRHANVHNLFLGQRRVHVEAYISREINFFFNAIFLAYIYANVVCNKA